jgi:exosortase
MTPPAPRLRRWNGAAWLAAVAGAWLWSWGHLAGEWRLAENYRYGFSVPLLLAALAWIRLPDRREPPPTPNPRPSRGPVAAALALFLAAELFREMDPFWRAAHGLSAAAATCLSAAWLDRLGGRALLRRMAFPLAFAWTAVPWPMGIEVPLANLLMRLVAGFAADALNLAGIAALHRGNLIELKNGILGVDTACSGIQSLQAGLMVALFLGDFLALSRGRRAALLPLAAALAFLGNLARTVALAAILGTRGMAAESRLHDPTGYAATAAIFGLLGLAAWRLRPRTGRRDGPATLPHPRLALVPAGRAGLLAALVLLASPFLARGWFALRGGPSRIQAAPLWRVADRPLPRGWAAQPVQLPPATLDLLMCSASRCLVLRTDDALPAEVTHLFWKPGTYMPSLGWSHTPDICMVSAGWKLQAGPAPASFRVDGRTLPGARFRFRLNGQDLTIFHAVWHGGEPRPPSQLPVPLAARLDRLQQLWDGRRDRGHETLTVTLPTLPTESATHEALQRLVSTLLSPAPAGP